MHYIRTILYKILSFTLNFVMIAVIPKVKVIKGENSTERVGKLVKEKKGSRVLIVTDKVIHQLGLVDGVKESLETEEIPYFIYDGVKPDPTKSMVLEVVTMIKNNNVDLIVAIGGGSSMDCAKAASGVALNPKVKKYIGMYTLFPFTRGKGAVEIIAIPTTAGTGAELTLGAIISDPDSHIKGPVFDPAIAPKLAILDSKLFTGLPPHVTAATAMDALTHLMEGYTSWWRLLYNKKYYDKIIVEGVKNIFTYLPVAYKDGKNLEAREALAVASYNGGIMINRVAIANVHAAAHNIGGIYNISHGEACAMVLPHHLEYSFSKIYKRLAMLALDLGWATKEMSKKDRAKLVIKKIKDLQKEVNISSTHKFVDGSKDKQVITLAYKEQFSYPVSRYYKKKEYAQILKDIRG
ncbi:iron-containing alcohol dehydrogenase [Mycoplasmatota bacterium WC44]